jgi:hypothetical protein
LVVIIPRRKGGGFGIINRTGSAAATNLNLSMG